MSFIGNLLWFVFGGGFALGLTWLLYGLLWCCTIIGIPFGIACFRIASFSFFPFGKELVPAEYVGEKAAFGSGLANVLWVIFCGLWLAIFHILVGISECCTIIGIPFGLANFRIAKAAFAPLGKRVVSSEVAKAAAQQYAARKLQAAMPAQQPPMQGQPMPGQPITVQPTPGQPVTVQQPPMQGQQ